MTKFKIKHVLSLLLVIAAKFSTAQDKDGITWYNPAKEEFKTVNNQIWTGNEINSFYDRLPARAKPLVRKEVWSLSENAAGLKLIFNTDAQKITVRYVTSKDKKNYAMSHFPATGVSGLDLFAENSDGSWALANGKYSFQDTITYTYSSFTLDQEKYNNGRKFHLYLPLYNGIKWLEIGVANGSTFKFIPVSNEKPIIVYGTSIAQGGCASRPGMAWTNILNRNLHIPIANLGFSGNGRLEKEVIDLIIEKDAKIFILDCLPNLLGEVQNIRDKTIYAVNTIREKHPSTPIILVDLAHYTEERLNTYIVKNIENANNIAYNTYKELQSKGVNNLYYLKHADIDLDMNDSVDGTHPTDIGMLKYAKAYEKLIRKMLK